MSKKKYKKKKERKERLSSSSSQEEERFPQGNDREHKALRKKLLRGHSRYDRSAKQPHGECSSNIKGLPETSHRKDRKSKHPDYRKGKPPCSEKTWSQNPGTGTGTSSFRQNKVTVGVLGIGATTDKTLGQASSSTQHLGKMPQVTENTSLSKKSPLSTKNPSQKSKQHLTSSCSTAELRKHRRTLVHMRSRHEEQTYTRKEQSETFSNPEQSVSLAEELREKRRKLVQRRSQEQRDQAVKTKRELVMGKTSNTSIKERTVQSFTRATSTTSGSSKQHDHSQGRVTQQSKPIVCSQIIIPPRKPAMSLSFKIPKTTKLEPFKPAIWDDVKGSTHNKPAGTSAKSVSTVSFRIGPKPSGIRKPPKTVPGVICSSPKPLRHGEGVVIHTSPIQRVALPCEIPPWTDQYKSAGGQPNATDNIYGNDQEMQLIEELHQARFEKRLELNVIERYGELTCMDIDPSEEGTANTLDKNTLPQDLIIVLDTNILLSHLDYIKKIRSRGLGALGFPAVLVPWVVLQELDSLKNGRRLSSSVAHLATPAVQYIYSCLKSQEPRLWGQSMQQAAQSGYGLSTENNDDRVLQCCLQYQSLYPEGALVLCTNDKNLCSKAILSGVRALSKADLEVEVAKHKPWLSSFLLSQTPLKPQPDPRHHGLTQTQTPAYSRRQMGSKAQAQAQTQAQAQAKTLNPTLQTTEEGEKKRVSDSRGRKRGKETDREPSAQELSTCLSLLEDCLRSSLSQILEVEMKAAYDDLWTEIVYKKPPWGHEELLQCFRKHWIAVFGNIVPRGLLSTVTSLDNFLNSGRPVEQSSTAQALVQTKELLQAFRGRSDYSGLLPAALLSLDSLIHRVSSQSSKSESPERDAPMSDGEETQSPPSRVTHQEVWSLFERVWTNVYQISTSVFAALNFDPGTMEVRQLEGSAPPSQDALSFLPKLSSAVRHLLHAFSRLLSPDSDVEDTQALLVFIQSSEIATVEARLTAKDLLDCFTLEEYREKLRVGGLQLTELNVRLEHCVEATSQMNNPIDWS